MRGGARPVLGPGAKAFSATELEAEIANAGFTIMERGRHGSERKDARIFIVARKSDGS